MFADTSELSPVEQQYLRQRYRFLLGKGVEPDPGKLSPRKITELDFLAYSIAAKHQSVTADNILEFHQKV